MRAAFGIRIRSRSTRLFVTNAGANFFSVFAPTTVGDGMQWSLLPHRQHVVGSESGFGAITAANKMEGGPKGIAIERDTLAVCSPRQGVLLYALRWQVAVEGQRTCIHGRQLCRRERNRVVVLAPRLRSGCRFPGP